MDFRTGLDVHIGRALGLVVSSLQNFHTQKSILLIPAAGLLAWDGRWPRKMQRSRRKP